MNGRHGREAYLIVGEGLRRFGEDGKGRAFKPTALQSTTQFRFSRFAPIPPSEITPNETTTLVKLAVAMNDAGGIQDEHVPAGYTYLGQFIDHDLTLDETELDLSRPISVPGLISKRSPSLDLDSLYGEGPSLAPRYYQADGVHLKVGRPTLVGENSAAAQDGMDLPRHPGSAGPRRGTEREASIPDIRNDENLAVAQIHAAFIRFHNKCVDILIKEGTPSAVLFDRARELVTKHYQWLIKTDYLPRIVEPAAVDKVFNTGRTFFEINGEEDATMPIEFSGAAFRLGHSQVRAGYQWNKIFNREAGAANNAFSGSMFRLFRFSGTSGSMAPSDAAPGSPEDFASLEHPENPGVHLPSIWVADFTRLFDLQRYGAAFKAPADGFNNAMAIDTHVVNPLKNIPIGSFGSVGEPDLALKRNLAFRNLARGRMLGLPSGQQLAAALSIQPLTEAQILDGSGGAQLPKSLIDGRDRQEAAANTPLWFYVLREAEVNGVSKNKLTGVGATLVAETFHRAMEKSANSIVADPGWTPRFGDGGRFDMGDLLFFAFDGRIELLNPHG
jgi:hypothetical protein